MANTLPSHHKTLVLKSLADPLTVEQRPTPQPGAGSVVVKVLLANVVPYAADVYSDSPARPYPFPMPFTPGFSAVARVAATGADTTALKAGDLVLIDSFIIARDDPASRFLFGLHSGATAGSRKLMDGEWRDGTYAEYAKVPLENCIPLSTIAPDPSERVLNSLVGLAKFMVPLGGFSDIGLKPGETVIIAPATGYFGGCAVEAALALGARVVAAGRNADALKRLEADVKNKRLRTVRLTGDVEADAKNLGPADAFQDWSPPEATNSTHFKSALLALKLNGRASIMGGIRGDVAVPYSILMHNNLTLKGKWMYDADVKAKLLQLVEAGLLELKPKTTQRFPLDQWKEAFEHAAANPGWDSETLIAP